MYIVKTKKCLRYFCGIWLKTICRGQFWRFHFKVHSPHNGQKYQRMSTLLFINSCPSHIGKKNAGLCFQIKIHIFDIYVLTSIAFNSGEGTLATGRVETFLNMHPSFIGVKMQRNRTSKGNENNFKSSNRTAEAMLRNMSANTKLTCNKKIGRLWLASCVPFRAKTSRWLCFTCQEETSVVGPR